MSTPIHSFPHATSHTLLAKFKQQHEDNKYFLGTPVLEPAFIIQHFAGRVKYQIKVGSAQYPLFSDPLLFLSWDSTFWGAWNHPKLQCQLSQDCRVLLGPIWIQTCPPFTPWASMGSEGVTNHSYLTRTSGRRTWTTCGLTSWHC